MNMTEEGRIQEAENMTQQEKQMIMTEDAEGKQYCN